MSDGMTIIIGDDGKARAYDDTYDITIHCESKEEQDEVKRRLMSEPHWIPCTERMPHNTGDFYLCTAKLSVDDEYEVELLMLDTANDFDKSYFSKCIHNGLVFRESWSGANEALDVIAWMPLPEPYRGGET